MYCRLNAFPPLSSKPLSSPLLLLKFPNCGENLVGSLVHGEGSPFRCEASRSTCRGVDLRRGEPGQGREDVVEQVLPDVDHYVFVFPDPLHYCVPILKCDGLKKVSDERRNMVLPSPTSWWTARVGAPQQLWKVEVVEVEQAGRLPPTPHKSALPRVGPTACLGQQQPWQRGRRVEEAFWWQLTGE